MSKHQPNSRSKGGDLSDTTSDNPPNGITIEMLTQILSAFTDTITASITASNQQIIDQLALINENFAKSHSELNDAITTSQHRILDTESAGHADFTDKLHDINQQLESDDTSTASSAHAEINPLDNDPSTGNDQDLTATGNLLNNFQSIQPSVQK
jgi:hypothetical protein